ncbi:GIY-YIG nuclease family protein [Emticicia sp. CRIBPO]|uniref:GIY-YIG nuclease family protein n=1 Tax=Emticicia sp. CRIBPO TaxID=2683258 RepID=UPI001412E96D|nr:GIY-YIG nuclease family protein [Emticicia sp. CRIBPO]NBA85264.1 GIY-YIG nuclease family protein [Emticicia sp. CRIBPO]
MYIKSYCVYILHCSDDTYYVGLSSFLEQRLIQHREGLFPDSYTFKRRPVELQFYAEFTMVHDAIAFEKKIKKWSRSKKKALIESDWNKLRQLAACKNETNYKNYNKDK